MVGNKELMRYGAESITGTVTNALRKSILSTANFIEVSGFPENIDRLTTLPELVLWLGTTDFQLPAREDAAVELLIQTANTLQYQTGLHKFARWAERQVHVDPFISSYICVLDEYLHARETRYAFETASLLARTLASGKPDLKLSLAEWTISLADEL